MYTTTELFSPICKFTVITVQEVGTLCREDEMKSVKFRSERGIEIAQSSLLPLQEARWGKDWRRSLERSGEGHRYGVALGAAFTGTADLSSLHRGAAALHAVGCVYLHKSPELSEKLLPKAAALMFWVTRPSMPAGREVWGWRMKLLLWW